MNPYTCHCRVWIITDMQKGNWPVNTVVVVLFFFCIKHGTCTYFTIIII